MAYSILKNRPSTDCSQLADEEKINITLVYSCFNCFEYFIISFLMASQLHHLALVPFLQNNNFTEESMAKIALLVEVAFKKLV
jgi:hypothetical protein